MDAGASGLWSEAVWELVALERTGSELSIDRELRCYKVPVKPGPEGMAEFRSIINSLLGLPEDAEFHVAFQCAVPTSGERLTLSGMECFNAAATCAAISAAKKAAGEDPGFELDE